MSKRKKRVWYPIDAKDIPNPGVVARLVLCAQSGWCEIFCQPAC